MSFYSDASLVVEPAIYKAGTLFSAKPGDGSGDLTFTRSNDTATRVGPDGLIEKVRTNLILQSQTFDNASWNKTTDGQVTITANAATAPDGTTTAEKMIPSAIAGFHCVAQTITLSAGEVTISVFAKAAENSFLQIFDSLTTDFANFNLTTGAVGSTDAYVASIQSAGNGWFRCTATKVVPSGSFVLRYGVVTTATAARGESFTGNGTDGLLIWGAQAEQGVATDYIATTTAAVSVGPVANVPRLDYLNSSCPRLLLEPQRTNLFTYSEQLNTGTSGATATPNQAVSPDGYTNADLITGAGANNYIAKGISGAFSGTHTFSIFLKAGTDSAVGLDIYDGSYYNATYNLATGVASGTGASMVSYGNGWYRCILTRTTSANPVEVSVSSIGDGLTIYAWGGQFEANASYATSYIPTLGAAVTRGADAASKTGISSLIGQTEGTVYVKFKFNAKQGMAFQIATATSYVNAIYLERITDSFMAVQCWVSGVQQVSILLGGLVDGQTYSVAVAYKANDFAVYRDGALIGTDTSASLPASFNNFYLGNFGGAAGYETTINQALLFKTRLTNAQMQELTSL